MVAITLPDGSVREFAEPVTGAALAADIGPGLAKAALAIRLNGELQDLKTAISSDASVAIVTAKDEAALELLRHDAAHVMAQAVQELYPNCQSRSNHPRDASKNPLSLNSPTPSVHQTHWHR